MITPSDQPPMGHPASDSVPPYNPLATIRDAVFPGQPQNLEIERALLGILLSRGEAYYNVCEIVKAEDFYEPLHGRLYGAIAKTVESGRIADLRTVPGMFAEDHDLKALGGKSYLADLIGSYIAHTSDRDYANHINTLATRRRLWALGDDVKAIASNQNAPPVSSEQLINQVESKLFNLAERQGSDTAADLPTIWRETIKLIDEGMRRDSNISGFTSGLAKLDKMLDGFQPECLYTIAGRPGMGKTAIGLTLALNTAMSGTRVLFHSLEMARTDMMARLIARMTGIPANRQRARLEMADFMRIAENEEQITKCPLVIDDGARLKLSQIRSRAIRRKRKSGLDLLVIDYLGLMKPVDKRPQRNYEIEDITTGLKALAKELKIPIILLAQLNRQVEQRDDKRPMLADLRDSGAVEQDSDVVMFIHREEYYLGREEPRETSKETREKFRARYDKWESDVAQARGRAELIIAKHRQGENGVVSLRYDARRCHFYDEHEVAANAAANTNTDPNDIAF